MKRTPWVGVCQVGPGTLVHSGCPFPSFLEPLPLTFFPFFSSFIPARFGLPSSSFPVLLVHYISPLFSLFLSRLCFVCFLFPFLLSFSAGGAAGCTVRLMHRKQAKAADPSVVSSRASDSSIPLFWLTSLCSDDMDRRREIGRAKSQTEREKGLFQKWRAGLSVTF